MRSAKRGGRWLALLLALGVALPAGAADITRGITFTDGQRLTAAQLHSLVDSATIGVAFLTGKDVLASVDSADYALIYDTSTGTFKKMTLATLIMGNTGLITTQPEVSPAGLDYVLIYDASALGFGKVSLTNLLYGNTNLIVGQYPITNLLGTAQILVNNDGTNNRISLAHLWFNNFEYTRPFTNQLQHTAPTNADALLIWDSFNGTNKWITMQALNTNLPVAVNPTNTATLTLYETGQVKKVTLTNLMQTFATSGAFLTTNITWRTNGVAVNSGVLVNAPHGLGVTPAFVRWVLVMGSTTELGYTEGDEVDLINISQTSDNPAFGFGANATHVWLLLGSTSINMNHKTTGARANFTLSRWTAKGYVRP